MINFKFDWDKLNIQQKQIYIEKILDNKYLENALVNLKNNKNDVLVFAETVKTLAWCIENNRGIVLAVDGCNIGKGQFNLDLIYDEVDGDVQCGTGEDGKNYAIVFTSREKFNKKFPEYSGGVLFWNHALEFFIKLEKLAGIIINPGENEIVLPKDVLIAIAIVLGDIFGNIFDE